MQIDCMQLPLGYRAREKPTVRKTLTVATGSTLSRTMRSTHFPRPASRCSLAKKAARAANSPGIDRQACWLNPVVRISSRIPRFAISSRHSREGGNPVRKALSSDLSFLSAATLPDGTSSIGLKVISEYPPSTPNVRSQQARRQTQGD
jgi:hypothetical protein